MNSGASVERQVAARVRTPRKRRWPRIVGGLLLVVVGGLAALVSYGGGWAPVCATDPYTSAWWPVEPSGNAVAITSSVLEFESGTGGLSLFCENDRALRVRAIARPIGRKPVFLGVGQVTATRRYLSAGRYEIAATYMSLDHTRRFGDSVRRLTPPAKSSFWRSYAISTGKSVGGRARLTHQWRATGADPFAGGTRPSERFWLVLMNADGSPGVAADLRFEVGLAPRTRWPWLIGIMAGIGLVAAGTAVAIRRPRSTWRHEHKSMARVSASPLRAGRERQR
jgi:hypothetical protein